MRPWLLLPLAVFATTTHQRARDWSEWECPGFPCFIVNFFEYRPFKSLKQTCGPVDQMVICNKLMNGESFPAVGANGTAIGTHHMTQPHPCRDLSYGCWQVDEATPTIPTCLSGSLKGCYANCGKLQLLDVYNQTCYDVCEYQCNTVVA